MGRLAEEVSGASPDLVERVLDEYGDPASDEGAPEADAATGSNEDTDDGGAGPSDDGETRSAGSDVGQGSATAGDTDQGPTLIADGSTNGAALDRATNGHDAHFEPSSDGDDHEENDSVDHPDGSVDDADPDGADDERDGRETTESDPTDTDPADTDASDVGSDVESDVESSSGDAEPAGSDVGDGASDVAAAAADLDDRELAILREVARNPTATQAEIADELGVSRATVSRRVNAVEGLEWSDRTDFVERAFADEFAGERSSPDADALDDVTDSLTSLTDTVADLSDDVERLETELSESDGPGTETREAGADGEVDRNVGGGALSDPELAHKVVHACMDAEYVSEDEELRVVRAILDDSRTS